MPAATAKCPECGRRLPAPSPYRPFCSERCRLLDLGAWLDGRRAIPDEEPVPEPGPEQAGPEDAS